MELLETCAHNLTNETKGCKRRYVQPPREKSLAPRHEYCPPSKPLDILTTYHSSYLDKKINRSQPFRPKPCLRLAEDKFENDTTNAMSYKPFSGIVRRQLILPKQRTMIRPGLIENLTTSRIGYTPKSTKKREQIIPCGQICLSKARVDDATTTGISYMNPGPVQPTLNYKPINSYCPPTEPIPSETTTKLSYPPIVIPSKEKYIWAEKPTYTIPNTSMWDKTTYSESYLKNSEQIGKLKAIIPISIPLLPYGAEFTNKTMYTESFVPCKGEQVSPIIPSGTIALSDEKMATDTTNKLSYMKVCIEKREPIIPKRRNMLGQGPMQNETTNRQEFVEKIGSRVKPVIPSNNIDIPGQPMQDETTTALSFKTPGPTIPVQAYKPINFITKIQEKLDTDTVNHLSYRPWQLQPKEEMPWAQKTKYKPPDEPMVGNTMYNQDYAPPGYYIEENCQ